MDFLELFDTDVEIVEQSTHIFSGEFSFPDAIDLRIDGKILSRSKIGFFQVTLIKNSKVQIAVMKSRSG